MTKSLEKKRSKIQAALQVSMFGLAASILLGCHEKRVVAPPETFPVSGKLVSRNGKIPSGYWVCFAPSDPEKTAFGVVEPDGSFQLTTKYLGVKCEGAASGNYRVTLSTPGGASPPVTLVNSIAITGATSNLEIPCP